ncbi:MAG TPA: helicase HerA-like domain-containing protein [Ilumatobacteraceae bacterium]
MADLFLGGLIDAATHERTGADLHLASDDFTTHGVIVGMTGSGKTGLGIVLVEEVLRAGIPALLIDPKGDLTNLCLTFPGLTADEFRPWIDESQARSAGAAVDDFAVQQADLWREGLAGWKLGPADVEQLRAAAPVTVYTPGSDAGTPLDIVGSLQAPAESDDELVADEIEGYVSGLLGLVGVDADPLASRDHILLSNLIAHAWKDGRDLDLMTLVGMVPDPPMRKLGVFELDQFFPSADRLQLAMRLNGLLASPSFAAWSAGAPLDIQSLLYGADGRPRCAVITTAHLSDDERQFVTALVLAKLVTWMRRQSGTSELRALMYMDEVVGYLPPTAAPPTKKPILTLMKQARAFGLGVVLSTQNPVDVDYKALSNAGTWMIGRLQTDRDKQRLLDGMSAASGGVDIAAVGDTISGLAKREFVLRRAGKDQPEVFTTRWAMSYLRGPLTREQIRGLSGDAEPSAPAAEVTASPAPSVTAAAAAPPPSIGDDETSVMPTVAEGIAVRWAAPSAPWLADVGADPAGTKLEAALVARVHLRYDEAKADLVHDTDYEAVLRPIAETVDVTRFVAVDHDERDLRVDPPANPVYRLTDAPIGTATFFRSVERELGDHLARTLSLEVPANPDLKLYGRPGEPAEAFAARCLAAADEHADAAIAKLRDRYEAKVTKLRDQIAAAEDRADVVADDARRRADAELLSTAGSILGGLLGGRKSRGGLIGSVLGGAGSARRGGGSSRRVDEARNKVGRLVEQLEDVEAELAEEVHGIDAEWQDLAERITTVQITLERTDVKVTGLALAWLPVSA